MTQTNEPEMRPEDKLDVALCREANDLRALHKIIGARVGLDPWVYWDCQGTERLGSAVEGLLAIAGFAGSAPSRPTVRQIDEDDVNCIPVLGFTVKRDRYATVRAAIQAVGAGHIGGFSPLVVAQAGYHDAALDVFSYVWSQAGRPQIWIRSPDIVTRGGASGNAPETLLPFAKNDLGFSMSEYIRGLGGKAPIGS